MATAGEGIYPLREFTGPGGLRLADVREALEIFARQKNLLAVEVTAYNPERDPDGAAAKMIVELVVAALAARLAALSAPTAALPEATPVAAAEATVAVAEEIPARADADATAAEPEAAQPATEEQSETAVPDAESNPS